MRTRITSALAAALLLAACAEDGPAATGTTAAGDDGGSATIIVPTTTVAPPPTAAPVSDAAPATTSPGTTATGTEPTAANTDAPTTAVTPPTVPTMGDPRVSTMTVASFDQPVDLVVRPGDSAFFVVEQRGQIVRYERLTSTTVADLSDRIVTGSEQGLLGLAFDPAGERAYVNYTDIDGDTTISEFVVAADGSFDIATERILLTVDQPYRNHNAGDLAFGPDGMLYFGLGDGGSGGDPERRASDPTVLLGSLLRIDPTPSDTRPYSIPPDNPFADGPLDGIEGAAEVWSWGLRNPWKFDFDPRTGDLWIADVGQNLMEEVNLVSPTAEHPAAWAADFGWSGYEGTDRFNDDVADTGRLTSPVLTYEHGDDGCSISGGVPYVGSAIPELLGGYVYSDYCSGRLWALDLAGQRNLTLLDGLDAVTAVRTGPDGEIYIVQRSGDILRLVDGVS